MSRGWLIALEAPGHPWHPPSTQLDAVVNYIIIRSFLLTFVLTVQLKPHTA